MSARTGVKSRAQSKHQHVDSTDRFDRTKEYKGSVSPGSRARITGQGHHRMTSARLCSVICSDKPARPPWTPPASSPLEAADSTGEASSCLSPRGLHKSRSALRHKPQLGKASQPQPRRTSCSGTAELEAVVFGAEELERWASTDCAVAGRPYPVREKGRAAAKKPGSADGADCALAPPGAAEPGPASLPAAQELPSRTYRGALQLRPALVLPGGAAGRSRRNPAPPSPQPVSASPRGTGTPLPPPPLSQRARWNARGWSCSWQTRARTWKRAERRPLRQRRRRRRRRPRWPPRPAGTTRMIACVSTRVRDANIVWPWLPGFVVERVAARAGAACLVS
jgi:hypothetical protein